MSPIISCGFVVPRYDCRSNKDHFGEKNKTDDVKI